MEPTEGGKRRSKWMVHVMKTKRAHKGKPLSEVLKIAAGTYKKKGGASLSPAEYSPSGPAAPVKGGRRGRSTRRRKH